MRICELNPEYGEIYKDQHLTKDNSGFTTGVFSLSFVCPDCGPPHVVRIKISGTEDRSNGVWGITPWPPFKGFLEHASMTASINNVGAGHGKKHPTCTFHKTLVKGEFI